MDDTFVVHKAEHVQQFLTHLNLLNLLVHFTTEDPSQYGFLHFLDTLLSVGPNGSLVTAVYRKPTHMDQYLHWVSQHSISAKHSVVNTLTHRAQTVCSDQQLLGQEQLHIRTGLSRCSYPDWVFHRFQTKLDYHLHHQDHSTNCNTHRDMDHKMKKHLHSGPILKRT